MTESYFIPAKWVPDLIHRLSEAAVSASSVQVELETFDDGDVNVVVAGRLATTLKKE